MINARKYTLIAIASLLFLIVNGYQACSPVKFAKDDSSVEDLNSEPELEPPTTILVDPPVTPPPITPKPVCAISELQQPNENITNKLDLLFAVDTSGSLDNNRSKIAEQVNSFLVALPTNIEVNIGVLLGHGSGTKEQSSFVGKLYRSDSSEPFVLELTPDRSNMVSVNDDLIKKMTPVDNEFHNDGDADGGEEVLFSLSELLKPAATTLAKSQGFFREDAGLAVIFVGDEADICARDANGNALALTSENGGIDDEENNAFNRDCDGVTPENILQSLITEKTKPHSSSSTDIKYPLTISAITYLDPNDGEIGSGYIELVNLNNGVLADLSSDDFYTQLNQIGDSANTSLSLFNEFKMANPAFTIDPSSITVRIGDPLNSANRVPASQFTFDAANLTFKFADNEKGNPGDVIEMNYCELITNSN